MLLLKTSLVDDEVLYLSSFTLNNHPGLLLTKIKNGIDASCIPTENIIRNEIDTS